MITGEIVAAAFVVITLFVVIALCSVVNVLLTLRAYRKLDYLTDHVINIGGLIKKKTP